MMSIDFQTIYPLLQINQQINPMAVMDVIAKGRGFDLQLINYTPEQMQAMQQQQQQQAAQAQVAAQQMQPSGGAAQIAQMGAEQLGVSNG